MNKENSMIVAADMEHFGYFERKILGESVAEAIKKTKQEHETIRRTIDALCGNPSPFMIFPVMRLWMAHERDEIKFLHHPVFSKPPRKVISTGNKIQTICEGLSCGILGDAVLIKGVQEKLIDDIDEHMKLEEDWFKDVYARIIFH